MRFYTDVKLIKGRIASCAFYYSNKVVPQAKGKAPVQNTTTNTAPWSAQQPYLQEAFSQAQKNYQANPQGYGFFPGQTYAPMSGQSNQALQGMEQRALQGSPLQRAGSQQMLKVAQGDYLHSPYLRNAIKAEYEDILPQLQSQAARSGNFHSSAAQLAQAKEFGKIADRRMSEQYNLERARQDQAAQMAPQYAQSEYADLQRLMGVGGEREAEQQRAIDEAMARHEYAANAPNDALARYLGLVQGNYGSQGTETINKTGFRGNRASGMLSGALGGAGAGAPFGPWGMAGGAALGGLLGGFV